MVKNFAVEVSPVIDGFNKQSADSISNMRLTLAKCGFCLQNADFGRKMRTQRQRIPLHLYRIDPQTVLDSANFTT